MTAKPEHVGRNDVTERELFLLNVARIADVPTLIDIGSKYFGVFLACDARNEEDIVITDLGRGLMANGMRYFSSWGSNCERVHDLIDSVVHDHNPNETENSVIITMWFDEKSLDEALWQFLYVAFPATDYEEDCKADLAIVVGNENWVRQIKTRVSDLNALNKDVVGEDVDND